MRLLSAAVTAMVTGLLMLSSSASAAVVPARSAAAFHDSVGVNTHIVYFDTAYGDWSRVVGKLDDLGVDHLRDGVYANPGWRDWNERYYQAVELAAAHGKRFDVGVGEPNFGAGTLDQLLAVVHGRLRNAVDALEAPNEYDLFHGGPNWAGELRSYQQALYAKAKADPSLRNLPVIGPSLVYGDSRDKLGRLDSSMDFGNLHPYTGGEAPSLAHLQSEAELAAKVSGRKPLFATEVGFHNALSATQGQAPVSEQVAASYLLRTYLEHFRAGISRTYAYELIDEKPDPAAGDPEQHFGLLRNDFSEKPAFVALKRLLALVGRPGNVTSSSLDLSLGGDTQGVQQMLLKQSANRYALVLWQSASQWDTARRRALSVPARNVALTLPADAQVSYARPAAGGVSSTLTQRRVSLAVPADPIVVELDFGRPPPVAVAPASSLERAPTAACTGAAKSSGIVLAAAGATARVWTRRSSTRPIRVQLCVARSGTAVVALGRSSRKGRLSRVLASRRFSVAPGKPVTVDLRWSRRALRALRASGRGPALSVRYRSRGARHSIVLGRRLSMAAMSPRR